FGEAIIEAVYSHYGPKTEKLKRENELLQREVTQLREQVGLERGLRELRNEVEEARSQVPRVPDLVSGLEKTQKHLERELAKTKEKLSRVRVNQSVADFKLKELARETRKQATNFEMKIESTVASFRMTEMSANAAATLRNIADATLAGTPRQDEQIWVIGPSPTADAA